MNLPACSRFLARRRLRSVLASWCCVVLAAAAFAAEPARPFLSPIFGDHMVLQRGKPNVFWGWATPGERVTVELDGRSASATAAADGRWRIAIAPPPEGGPYTVRVTGPQTVELADVLVGDVWLCSGQSNMQFALAQADGGAEAAAAASDPQLRLYRVPQRVAYAPANDPGARWRVCSPEEAAGFSAVGYFFGRRLQTELGVPIGLVQAAVGGSPIESWMSPAALGRFPAYASKLREIERLQQSGAPRHGSFLMHWLDEHDRGLAGDTWAAPGLDASDWTDVTIPGGFADLGVPDAPAIAWFRREVVLPDPLPAGPARLRLGVVEKMDTAYLNGQWVGASSWVENPRNYAVPAGVLRPGVNVLALRVFKLRSDGGFQDPGERLALVLGDGREIPLAGAWRGKVSRDARPPHPLPLDLENYPTMPTVLQQGMIAPVAPLALTGAIWYQGEANFTRAHEYRELLPALIADWRRLFGQANFPFYIVSLPAFMERRDEPGDDAWAELREAQALTARHVANTGLAVTTDTGDAADIHPREKRTVGERLAQVALGRHYGRPVVHAGPEPRAVERREGALAIHFANTTGGLVVRGESPPEFAIAGEDRRWHWAQVEIDGDTVVLRSPAVPQPVAARYAWQANPRATLFNGAGWPAGPFRTDDWPGTTAPRAGD